MATATQWLLKWYSTAEERERCALRVSAEVRGKVWGRIKCAISFILQAPNGKVICAVEKLSASSQVR